MCVIRRFLYFGMGGTGSMSPLMVPGLLYLSAARYKNTLWLYGETEGVDLVPEQFIKGKTTPFPDGRSWIKVPQIFYYNLPKEGAKWRRTVSSRPKFQIARLREDGVAPYVFYHYQLQEEERIRKSKYALIGLLGTLLVYYDENPPTPGETRRGSLDTANTPERNWSQQMSGYFETGWQPTELLFRRDVMWEQN
ncbi:MAG: hypothetical protein SO147_02225 [Clostridia bacterium]|nr:hypothetical protein [Clostridia bacterium]